MQDQPPVLRPVSDATPGDDRPAQVRSSNKVRPLKNLPTDRMNMEKAKANLTALVIASKYGQEPVNGAKVAPLLRVIPATAPLNHAFFADVGLLTKVGRGDYAVSPELVEYHKKMGFASNPKEAARLLAPEFAATWFFEGLRGLLQMGPATRGRAIELFANLAGTDATYRVQLGYLVDWLEYVGLVDIDGETITLAADAPVESVGPMPREVPIPPAAVEGKSPTAPVTPVEGVTGQAPAPVILSLSIELRLTIDDLAQLSSEQIKTLFEGVGSVASIKAMIEAN